VLRVGYLLEFSRSPIVALPVNTQATVILAFSSGGAGAARHEWSTRIPVRSDPTRLEDCECGRRIRCPRDGEPLADDGMVRRRSPGGWSPSSMLKLAQSTNSCHRAWCPRRSTRQAYSIPQPD